MRLSAGGAGFRPFFSSALKMKASIGDWTHEAFCTAGAFAATGGTKAQYFARTLWRWFPQERPREHPFRSIVR